jgi:hypothetical protein
MKKLKKLTWNEVIKLAAENRVVAANLAKLTNPKK